MGMNVLSSEMYCENGYRVVNGQGVRLHEQDGEELLDFNAANWTQILGRFYGNSMETEKWDPAPEGEVCRQLLQRLGWPGGDCFFLGPESDPWLLADRLTNGGHVYRYRGGDDPLMVAALEAMGWGGSVIADESLGGLGRTGRWFGYQHESVIRPDVVVMGPGGKAGPAVVAARPGLASSRGPEGFEQNQACMQLVNSLIDAVEANDLIARSRDAGRRLMDGVAETAACFQSVRLVRGQGLLISISFDREILPDGGPTVCRGMAEHRILVGYDLDLIRLIPPLVVDEAELAQMIVSLSNVLDDLEPI